MRALAPWLVILVASLLLAAIARGHKRLELDVLPKFGMANGDLRVRVRIEPNASNRQLAVQIDGPHFARRSDEQVDGLNAAVYRDFRFTQLPAGYYDIAAAVQQADGTVLLVDTWACFSGVDLSCAE